MTKQMAVAEVSFLGAPLLAQRGDTPATTLVALKPIAEALGLDWSAQLKRIKRHPVLSRSMAVMATDTIRGDRDGVALPLTRLNFYLATVSTKRVPDAETRERIIAYQEECADALFRHFFGQAAAKVAGIDAKQHGGITKAVVHAALEDHLNPLHVGMAELAAGLAEVKKAIAGKVEDRTATPAREYVSALDYLIGKGVPQKGRRGVVNAVSARLLAFSAANGFTARHAAETGTRLFHVDAIRAWEAASGVAFLRAWRDRREGQMAMRLRPGRGAGAGCEDGGAGMSAADSEAVGDAPMIDYSACVGPLTRCILLLKDGQAREAVEVFADMAASFGPLGFVLSARGLGDTAQEAGAAGAVAAEFEELALVFALLELADLWLADHPYLSRELH